MSDQHCDCCYRRLARRCKERCRFRKTARRRVVTAEGQRWYREHHTTRRRSDERARRTAARELPLPDPGRRLVPPRRAHLRDQRAVVRAPRQQHANRLPQKPSSGPPSGLPEERRPPPSNLSQMRAAPCRRPRASRPSRTVELPACPTTVRQLYKKRARTSPDPCTWWTSARRRGCSRLGE